MALYLENKRFNESEIEEKRLILQSKPLTLRLILTNQCNIDCIMCGLGSQKGRPTTIPYETIKQIVDIFPYLERLDWQGGEVFLVEYFKELLERASLHPNICQTLQTNGLLLNKDWAELLARYNVAVLFSIDGTTKETYEYIRRGAKFEDLLKNISIFNEYKRKYNSIANKILCVCIMRSNYMKLEEFVEFAIKYEFKQISFGAIHGTNACNENIFNPIDVQAMEYLKKKMSMIKKICNEKGIILECYFEPYLIDKKNDLVENHTKNNNGEIKCKLPWTHLCVDAIRDGNVYPECLCFKSIGNILRDRLLNIWNAPIMQQYRLAIANNDFKHICSDYCLKLR